MSNLVTQSTLDYFHSLVKDVKEKIQNNDLCKRDVCSYLRHLPKKGVEEGWPNEVYNMTEEATTLLYNYSLQHNFIEDTTSFEEFLVNYRTLLQVPKIE